MSATDAWPWLAFAGLGAYHGLNPGMGWLFAVALGLLLVAQLTPAATLVRPVGAVALVAFGVFKLVRPRSHPRWVGLRVGPRELVVWSFLMSSAHGAGLMLVPVLLGMPLGTEAPDLPVFGPDAATLVQDGAAVLVHTLAMLIVMGAVALAVCEKLGVGVLRRVWLNVDLLWAVAVVAAGLATLFS